MFQFLKGANGNEKTLRFAELKEEHVAKYQNILKDVLQSGLVVAGACDASGADDGGAAGEEPASELKVFESVAALEAADGPFKLRCASEISGIEVIKGKSGQIYILSDKNRMVAKHTLVGGFGSGKFLVSIQKICFDRFLHFKISF